MKNKLSNNNSLRISILGASGIGSVHARIFSTMGADVVSILSSTESSGLETARKLNDLFGIDVKFYTSIDRLFSESKPEAICISTPADMHFDHIIYAFERNIPVYCEKPLFCTKELTHDEIKEKINIIAKHPKRKLFMNCSSSIYIKYASKISDQSVPIKSFKFSFHTNGKYRNRDIADDLLPHAVTMLHELCGNKTVNNFNDTISDSNYTCSFSYGDTLVEFDFSQSKTIKKKFKFSINDDVFTRVQKGDIRSYKVYLKNPRTKKIIEILDPFEQSSFDFIQFCQGGNSNRIDDFYRSKCIMESIANMKLSKSICQRK